MPWTPEEARAKAREGGKARAKQMAAEREAKRQRELELAQLTPEERLEEAEKQFRAASPQMAERLIAAGLGQGVFKELKASEQLNAMLRCLEYGVGKPTAQPKEKPKQKDEESHGLQVV